MEAARAFETTTCVNCARPMRYRELKAHYGRTVGIDLCGDCHVAWFDHYESVNLSGAGVLELLRAMDEGQRAALHEPLRPHPGCARCGTRLVLAHDRTSHGPTSRLECPRWHGALQTFAEYLAEKGLVRPVAWHDLQEFQRSPAAKQLRCVNCGAAFDAKEKDACASCGSARFVVDLPLLVRAVDRQTGAVGEEVPRAKQSQFNCPHCGGPCNPSRETRCSHCAMPLAVPDLASALAFLETYAPAIESGKPTPARVATRMTEAVGSRVYIPPLEQERSRMFTRWWMYIVCAGVMGALGMVMLRCSPFAH